MSAPLRPELGATRESGGRVHDIRFLLMALPLLAITVTALQVAVDAAAYPWDSVAWGGLALAGYVLGLLCLVLAFRGPGHGPASWRLGPWMLIWVAVMYGLGSTVSITYPQILPSSVEQALWLVAVGTTVWAFGYLWGPGRLGARFVARGAGSLRRWYADEVRNPLAPWVMYGIGACARIVQAFTTHRFGYVGDDTSGLSSVSWDAHLLTMLGLCAPMGLAAAALRFFRERASGARWTMTVLFLAEVGFALTSGLKSNFVIAVMGIAVPYTAAKGRFPKVLFGAFVAVFLVIIIPFTYSYRSNARTLQQTLSVSQAIDSAPQLLRNSFGGEVDFPTVMANSVTYLLKRGQYIDSPSIVIQRTPAEIPFYSKSRLILGPISQLIPRILWAGKPINAVGYEFGQEYFGFSSQVYSSSATTPYGDLYRYGGWLPVIIGMLLLGCAMRILDDVIDVRANPQAVFLVLLMFPELVMAEQDWITLVADSTTFILMWWVGVALAFRRRGRAREPMSA
jgi:hypothetical protein